MKQKKTNMIITVTIIVVTLLLICLVVFGIVYNNRNDANDEYLYEQQQEQQREKEKNDNAFSEETSDKYEVSDSETGDTLETTEPDGEDKPDIDVGSMTKNPEAEVVESKIEYGTKEYDKDVE